MTENRPLTGTFVDKPFRMEEFDRCVAVTLKPFEADESALFIPSAYPHFRTAFGKE